MAMFRIQLVPEDRTFVPSKDQISQAESLLKSYCGYIGYWLRFERYDKLTLVDTGAAFEGMSCPKCHSKVDRFGIDSHGEWWAAMEDSLAESDSPLSMKVDMPCCGQSALIQDLDFAGQARFTFWAFVVLDYELNSGAGQLNSEELRSLEAAVGCKLVQLMGVG